VPVFLHNCHCLQVACVERYLTHIDELPEQYRSAEVVYLSRNSLRSLAGIQQFPCLRVLSASDNLLEDIEQLRVLEACPNLQVMHRAIGNESSTSSGWSIHERCKAGRQCELP
jgi:hypothetical protein